MQICCNINKFLKKEFNAEFRNKKELLISKLIVENESKSYF